MCALGRYDQELMISGIQHYGFCKRQWMLIHVENLWQENVLTFLGRTVHEKVDDPGFVETRGNVRTVRSLHVKSSLYGFYGVADLVEIVTEADGRKLVVPYEYKAGKPKEGPWDAYQLCLIAICLEEMMNVNISFGYIYYHRIRRKTRIEFDAELRHAVCALAKEMHEMYSTGDTVKAIEQKKCQHCSLRKYCMPLMKKNSYLNSYYRNALKEVLDEEASEYLICDD